YERGELACDAYFERVSASTGGLYAPDEVRRLHESWILGEYEGVSGLIDDLHRAGIATGVLSNTNASHWRQLTPGDHGPARFPAASKPRHLHASHLLGLAKPSRDIYRAFERLSGFPPASIVFFDDTQDNVRSAADAGWHARLVDHAGDTAAQMRAHLRALGLLGAD
ncbi:MAG: HAD-IA family hydrolase, partial [Phycisphaerae bacterium]|nr:HAD-IA family hydrolase [Phycisphaerae bacterium]